MKRCPYLELSFDILGRCWNGLIIHCLSNWDAYTAQFSQLKQDLTDITPRSLSQKLSKLAAPSSMGTTT